MTRRIVVMLLGMAAAATVLAAPASAGGFCSDPAADLYSDGSGDSVVMKESCFAPTVLRVGLGDTVTFVNRDPEFHAVGGVAGTFGDMHREIGTGKRVGITFEEEGVFPYVCILHPGMGGAIVVGDGVGAASVSLPVGREAETTTSRAAAPIEAATQPGGLRPMAAWGLGAALVAAMALAVVLLRRRAAPHAASGSVGYDPTA